MRRRFGVLLTDNSLRARFLGLDHTSIVVLTVGGPLILFVFFLALLIVVIAAKQRVDKVGGLLVIFILQVVIVLTRLLFSSSVHELAIVELFIFFDVHLLLSLLLYQCSTLHLLLRLFLALEHLILVVGTDLLLELFGHSVDVAYLLVFFAVIALLITIGQSRAAISVEFVFALQV